MGIFWTVLALLVIAALVCGVFFLVFKLIWLLLGKRSNKAPFWLSVGLTLLLAGGIACYIYSTYNTLVRPIVNLTRIINQKTTVNNGTFFYKDDHFGYGFRAISGMEFAEWIHYKGFHIQVAADANSFVIARQRAADKSTSYSGMITLIIDNNDQDDNDELFKKAQEKLEKTKQSLSSKGTLSFAKPRYLTMPQGQTAMFISGIYQDNKRPNSPMQVFILVAQNDKYIYVVSAMALQAKTAYIQKVKKEITSFQLI